MLKQKFLFLIAFLFLYQSNFSQCDCSEKGIKQQRKKIKKASCIKKPTLILNMAKCYKGINDSLYLQYARYALDETKRNTCCVEYKLRVRNTLVCAEASFILKDYKGAQLYYEKAPFFPDSMSVQHLKNYGISLTENKRYEDALKIFEALKIIYNTDSEIDEYEKRCRRELTAKAQ
jgi:tetratricopeptide (TPR) repeat protein